jgi:AcrR family transcriptional regulator
VSTTKLAEVPIGRQAAYTARNRAALIRAGQEILAEIGPSATIEQLAAHAEVSPTTIYKYFENKDRLFIEALSEMWHGWVPWAFAQTSTTDDLEAVVTLCRRLFRVKETHPHFAQVLHNTFKEMPDFFLQADEETAKGVFASLASAGQIAGDDFENRFKLWSSMFLTLNASVHVTEDLSPVQADAALGIALSVWGVTPARVKKLISRDLGLALLK